MSRLRSLPSAPSRRARLDVAYESEVGDLLERHSRDADFLRWLLAWCFGNTYTFKALIEGKHRKHKGKTQGDDPVNFGENDVEFIYAVVGADGQNKRVSVLIENKIDASFTEKQGPRYRSRAECRVKAGELDGYRVVLFAPACRLRGLFPLGDHADDGWDMMLSFEEVAARLADSPDDAQILIDATEKANHFNEPILSAVHFCKEYAAFGAARFPEVPVLVKSHIGSRAGGVWPSFYEGEFKNNGGIRRFVQPSI